MKKRRLIVIAGPTGSGKTALSVALAQKLGTEILSFDSRQIFKELNIAVAKPSEKELAAVPHHFISEFSIHDQMSAGLYEQVAGERLERLFNTCETVVAVGGTGMYLKALLQGMDPMDKHIPASEKKELRDALNMAFAKNGLPGLQQQMLDLDPQAATSVEFRNPARLIRAIELVTHLHQPLAGIRQGALSQRNYDAYLYGIDIDRTELYKRLDLRVDLMVQAGLEDEARGLFPHRELTALKTVGYSEWFTHFLGQSSRVSAIEKIKQHTRNYAKRQLTWFSNTQPLKWLQADSAIRSIFADLNL